MNKQKKEKQPTSTYKIGDNGDIETNKKGKTATLYPILSSINYKTTGKH